MVILINTQAFHSNILYDEILSLSKEENIKCIYIVSSLMHDLDNNTNNKYNSIDKVKLIKSTTLFSDIEFKKNNFTLSSTFLETEKYLYTDILSSYRWMPINIRAKNDMISFSMKFYYDVYNFWNSFFTDNHIDCLLQLNEEHSSLDSILIRTAKEYGVNKIITSRIVGAFSENAEEYHAFYDNIHDKYINLSAYKKDFEISTPLNINSNFKTFSKQYKPKRIDKIKYIFDKLNNLVYQDSSIFHKFSNLFNIVQNKLISKVLLIKQYFYVKSLKKYYSQLASDNIDHEKIYIYYCLHFDPEANTLPKDNSSSNQLLNLRILASSIPENWLVYVKEHPHQLQNKLYKNILLNQLHSVDNFRSKSFYQYINTIENVKLVSLEADHYKLMKNAEMIASNTGTIFREANYLKKYCITFSKKSIYNYLESVVYVNDTESCKNAISEYINSNKIIEPKVDLLFSNFSITITDIQNRAGFIFKFFNDNKIYNN